MHLSPPVGFLLLWSLSRVSSQSDDIFSTDESLDSNLDDTASRSDLFWDADGSSSDPIQSTDGTLSSACAHEQLYADNDSLLPRNEDSCPVSPLSPDTVQMFQDPLATLEDVIPANGGTSRTYADIVVPEEAVDKTKHLGPCDEFLLQGYMYHFCCAGPVLRGNVYWEYDWVSRCQPEPSTSVGKLHIWMVLAVDRLRLQLCFAVQAFNMMSVVNIM